MNTQIGTKPQPPAALPKATCSAKTAYLEWAERELMKMVVEESDPQLCALWSTAARIARERMITRKPILPSPRDSGQ